MSHFSPNFLKNQTPQNIIEIKFGKCKEKILWSFSNKNSI